MGEGIRDYDTGVFTPAETGVLFTYYWAEFPDTMYADLLNGIAAMSRGKLVIEDISEDHSNTDWADYEGNIAVSYTLNGKPQKFDAVFYQEWYDEQTFNIISATIQEETGNQLYFADYDDIGCFVFFGDDTWAEEFAKRTGLEISSDINDIY